MLHTETNAIEPDVLALPTIRQQPLRLGNTSVEAQHLWCENGLQGVTANQLGIEPSQDVR